MQSHSSTLKISVMAVVIGGFLGTLVFAEPYLVTALSSLIDASLMGVNVFKLFDFELTVALFAFLIFLLIMARILSLTYSVEKVFVVLYILGMQTIALTRLARFDLSEIIIIFFAFILLMKLFSPERRLTLTTLDLLNLLFITVLLLPDVYSGMSQLVDSLITGVKMVVITTLLVNYLKDMELVKVALKWVVIFTVISSVIAVGQFLLYYEVGYALVGFVTKDEFSLMIEHTALGPMLRVPAFFGAYKPFTAFLDAAILILFNYLLYNRCTLRDKILISLGLGVMTVALAMTFSKDAYLAFFIGIVISTIAWRPRLIFYCIALSFLMVAFLEAFGLVEKLWNSLIAEITWQEYRMRVILAKEGMYGFIYQHPWIGIGVRNSTRYTAHFNKWAAHNGFIQAADAGGMMGLIAYTALYVYTFKCLFHLLLIVPRGPERWISTGLFTGFISYLIMVQFNPLLVDRFLWFYMGLVKAAELKYIDPGPL